MYYNRGFHYYTLCKKGAEIRTITRHNVLLCPALHNVKTVHHKSCILSTKCPFGMPRVVGLPIFSAHPLPHNK